MMRWIFLTPWIFCLTTACALCAQSRLELLETSKGLLQKNPSAALEFATRAAASDELTQRWFWPIMLEAQVKLGKWAEAEASGSKSVESIEAGIMFTRFDQIPDEIKLRRSYAGALEHLGKPEAARRQIEIVDALQGGKAHPIVAAERSSRLRVAKAEVLASEVDQQYDLPVRGLAGRIVVVAFWASWCAPCIQELEILNGMYPQLRARGEVVAINIDDSNPADHSKPAYLFPMHDARNAVSTIPQLYVIDGAGKVRFHIKGFDDDGIFAEKINWMMEAASVPARH